MERRRQVFGGPGGGVVTEILYMIKRVRSCKVRILSTVFNLRNLADRK